MDSLKTFIYMFVFVFLFWLGLTFICPVAFPEVVAQGPAMIQLPHQDALASYGIVYVFDDETNVRVTYWGYFWAGQFHSIAWYDICEEGACRRVIESDETDKDRNIYNKYLSVAMKVLVPNDIRVEHQ